MKVQGQEKNVKGNENLFLSLKLRTVLNNNVVLNRNASMIIYFFLKSVRSLFLQILLLVTSILEKKSDKNVFKK